MQRESKRERERERKEETEGVNLVVFMKHSKIAKSVESKRIIIPGRGRESSDFVLSISSRKGRGGEDTSTPVVARSSSKREIPPAKSLALESERSVRESNFGNEADRHNAPR